MIAKLKEKLALLKEIRELPQVTVSLNYAGTLENHEFYQKITKDFYEYAHSRHKKLPLIRALEYGVALFDFRGEKNVYVERCMHINIHEYNSYTKTLIAKHFKTL